MSKFKNSNGTFWVIFKHFLFSFANFTPFNSWILPKLAPFYKQIFSGFTCDRQSLKFRTTSSKTCQKWKKVWMVVAQYANQGESLVLSMSLKMSWTAIRIMMIIIMSIINDHDLFDSIIDYKRDLSIIKIMNFFRS